MNRLVFGHININSIRNKFDFLEKQVSGNVDILFVSETKIDNTFPDGQFSIKGYSMPYRIDRNSYGGGLMLYVREDIPSKLLSVEDAPIEAFYVELNLLKNKWLLCCSYNPNKNNINNHIGALSKNLALYSTSYENLLLLGDFNVETDNSTMSVFCDTFNLSSIIKEPTCYKNPEAPSCIDLILTNKPYSFQNSCVLETGQSDFHKMTVTVLKATFQKLQPRIINYRDYKNFENFKFREDLILALSNVYLEFDSDGFNAFFDICRNILDNHAPWKKKYARGNHSPFINKTLAKEIM